jgi:hypothetical protein
MVPHNKVTRVADNEVARAASEQHIITVCVNCTVRQIKLLDEAATRRKSDAPSNDVMCMVMSSILAT